MIKFDMINGTLCRMLEKPVPLTPDAQFPCVVRLIQDDSPMGRSNAFHLSPLLANNHPIIIDAVKDYSVSVVFNNMVFYYANFEILGYPVAEGSKEWALWQMQQGNKVTKRHLKHTYWHYDARPHLKCISEYNCGTLQIMVLPEIWLTTAEPTGWQIYKEPKPLLADAKVGDLCQCRDGKWVRVIDTNAKEWNGNYPIKCSDGFCRLKDGKRVEIKTDFIEADIIHWEPLAPEGTAEWAWQMMLLGHSVIHQQSSNPIAEWRMKDGKAIGHLAGMYANSKPAWLKNTAPDGWQLYEPKVESCPTCNGTGKVEKPAPQYKVGDWVELETYTKSDFNADFRKLSPSDVVVDFGSFKGTIELNSHPFNKQITVKNTQGYAIAYINIVYLDTPTRELVQSLLKAQKKGE